MSLPNLLLPKASTSSLVGHGSLPLSVNSQRVYAHTVKSSGPEELRVNTLSHVILE